MKDILQQIQSLKEDFMNLIEVEGLGQPASDVPPSTNKIKKDRKTKNGKVELVSVEDELFPYDGNKREQYRQKIIDTINGMIQGTATLEDLLQVVRSQKNTKPVKEAIGLMENIYDAIRKKHGKPEYDDLHYTGSNKSYELMDAAQRAKDNEVKGAAEREGKSEKDILIKRKETKNSEGMHKTRHRSDIVADPWSNNKMDWYKYGSNDADRIKKSIAHHNKKSLKEAVELLEEVINEYTKEQRYEAALNSISSRNKKVKELEKNKGATSREKQVATNRLNQAKNIISTNGEGGLISDTTSEKTLPNGLKKITRRVAATPLNREGALENRDYRAGNSVSWTAHRKALGEAIELLEELIAEKHVFPKMAVADGNKAYLEADKKNNEATRLARKGFEKLNKKIKELKSKGIDTDVDIDPKVTYGNGLKKEYTDALKTAINLHNKQREADRKFTDADYNQRKLRAEGNTGVIKREFEPVGTKKGDGINFKHVLRTNESLREALKILEGLFVNDGRKDFFWNDIAGKSGTPVAAASNALKNKIDKAYKGTQKKMPVKEGLDKFEIAIDILEEMINEVSVKDAVQAAQNSIEDREKAHQSSHWCGDNYREKVAKELSSLPKSERNIKQLVNAARNSLKDRRAKWSAAFDNLDNEEGSKGDLARASKRRTHANIIAKLGAPKTDKEKTL